MNEIMQVMQDHPEVVVLFEAIGALVVFGAAVIAAFALREPDTEPVEVEANQPIGDYRHGGHQH